MVSRKNIFQFVEMDETGAAQFPWTRRLVCVFDWTFKVAQAQSRVKKVNYAQSRPSFFSLILLFGITLYIFTCVYNFKFRRWTARLPRRCIFDIFKPL